MNFGRITSLNLPIGCCRQAACFLQCGQCGTEAVQGQQAQDVVLLSALLKAVPWRRGHELLREAHDVADRQRLVCGAVMC